MATTYKLVSAAASDGVIYIDLPISGKITGLAWAGRLIAGAGGIGAWECELSRVAVAQTAISNPRGVLGSVSFATSAASTGVCANSIQPLDEPVKSGERLYLNCASASNWSSGLVTVFITIA